MPYELPSLPYSPNALEPYFDARTMEIHHGKHHQTYVDKLNGALGDDTSLSSLPIFELISEISNLPENIQTAVRNNGGGHANHIFLGIPSPNGPGNPDGPLANAINQSFGNFSKISNLSSPMQH